MCLFTLGSGSAAWPSDPSVSSSLQQLSDVLRCVLGFRGPTHINNLGKCSFSHRAASQSGQSEMKFSSKLLLCGEFHSESRVSFFPSVHFPALILSYCSPQMNFILFICIIRILRQKINCPDIGRNESNQYS